MEHRQQRDSRRAEVARYATLVALHHRQPIQEISEISGKWSPSVFTRSPSTGTHGDNRQPWGRPNRLLRRGERHIHTPGVAVEGLAADGADAVDHNQRISSTCQARKRLD